MYQVDDLDSVRYLADIPQPLGGAPAPVVVADERHTTVVYETQAGEPNWRGTPEEMLETISENPPIALVRFVCDATYFGPPNGEAFSGHPLFERGLKPYGAYEVDNSSWIRACESMNSVHQHHDREEFMRNRRHFAIVFHDSTFECIAYSYSVELHRGSTHRVLATVVGELIESDR